MADNKSNSLAKSDKTSSIANNKHIDHSISKQSTEQNASSSSDKAASTHVSNSAAEGKDAKAKAPTVTFNCELCNVQCSSEEVFQMHIKGQKHQRKLRRKQELEQYGIMDKIQNSDTYCKLCFVELTSKTHMLLHLSGRRHMQNFLKDLSSKNLEPEHTAAEVERLEKKQKEDEERLIRKAGITDFSKYDIPAERKTQALAQGAKNEFFCSLCTKYFSSKTQLAMHLVSSRHKEKEFPHLRLRRAGVGQIGRGGGVVRGAGYRDAVMSNDSSYRGNFKQSRFVGRNTSSSMMTNNGRFDRPPATSLYSSNSFNFSSDFSSPPFFKGPDQFSSNNSAFRNNDFYDTKGLSAHRGDGRSFDRNLSLGNNQKSSFAITPEKPNYFAGSTSTPGFAGGIKPVYSTYQSRVDCRPPQPHHGRIGYGLSSNNHQFSSQQWQSADHHHFSDNNFVGGNKLHDYNHHSSSYWNDFGGNIHPIGGDGAQHHLYSRGNKYEDHLANDRFSQQPSYNADDWGNVQPQSDSQFNATSGFAQDPSSFGGNISNYYNSNDYNPLSTDSNAFHGNFQSASADLPPVRGGRGSASGYGFQQYY
ncbi:hypothetical protein GJ496_007938 [Pomphorhynchus laevis]|nr:hypothetical protein GJ496_007938 [Pomphorhynchus laevis]